MDQIGARRWCFLSGLYPNAHYEKIINLLECFRASKITEQDSVLWNLFDNMQCLKRLIWRKRFLHLVITIRYQQQRFFRPVQIYLPLSRMTFPVEIWSLQEFLAPNLVFHIVAENRFHTVIPSTNTSRYTWDIDIY